MKTRKLFGVSRKLGDSLFGIGLQLAASVTLAGAQERLSRRFTMENGLPAAEVTDIAQTADGFLWITTTAGLVRFDGDEMRRWGDDVHDAVLSYVRVGPANQVVAGLIDHVAYEVVPEGLRAVTGPGGQPLSRFRFCNYDRQGNLWCTAAQWLWKRDRDGRWHGVDAEILGLETPHDISPLPAGGILLCTWEGGLWTIDGSGSARKVLQAPNPILLAIALAGDDFVYAQQIAAPYEIIVNRWTKGRVTELFRNNDRIRDIEERAGSIWLSFINRVVLVPPYEGLEGASVVQGVDSGGGMTVDHEGSLWIGTFTGLVQLPEPDTVTWNVHHGLPSSFFRSITGTDEGIWAASWHGLVRATREKGQLLVRPFRTAQTSMICADSSGGVWARQPDGDGTSFRLCRIRAGSASSYEPVPTELLFEFSCSPAGDGALWMTADRTILSVAPGDEQPRQVTVLEKSLPLPMGILADRAGNLWIHGSRQTVCVASVRDLLRTGEGDWACEDVGQGSAVHQLAETSTGEIWAATLTSGVLKRTDHGWVPLLTGRELGAPWVQRLQASRWGGMWVLGASFVQRFENVDGQWSIVESPGSWQGAPLSVARGLYEDADDNLWVASLKGVTYIPARVRRLRPPPPRVYLAGARVDGDEVAAQGPLHLPRTNSHIELRFSALSYREPGRLRYRTRWNGGEWTESRTPVIQAVRLSAGAYRIEASATIDGQNWSELPAGFTVFVPRPWYLRWWAIGIDCLILAIAVYALHRARIAHLLGLERQRARIAMDLHDELGSGLATINVLADIAAVDEHLSQAERATIHRQISESATVLGRSLTDLVWSLRPDSSSLDALVAHLAERAGQLFAHGKPELRVSFPEPIPPEPLSLAVRRNLQLIVFEALNNVRKHADASAVDFGLSPDGRGWRFWIHDNGLGNRSKASAGTGLGLASMRRRAEEIGAELDWIQDSVGTRLTVRFRSDGKIT